jgi:predicted O-linked N-acetylglucosamine transferase (SPINDLY family)
MASMEKMLTEAGAAFGSKQYDEAQRLYRQVLQTDPDSGVANYSLGLIAEIGGRRDEALRYMQKAAAQMTADPTFFYNYGLMLHRRLRYDDALEQYRQAVRLRPDYIGALNNIGAVLLIQGKLIEAEEFLRRSVALQPDYYPAYNNLGSICKDMGRYEEALANYRKALAIKPDDEQAGSNLLMGLCYCDLLTKEEVLSEHRAFERRLAGRIPAGPAGHRPEKREGRPLRIGYVSPDLRTHSVAYFIEPLLACHARDRYAVHLYDDAPFNDAVSQQLQRYGHVWRRILGRSDEEVCRIITGDRIDILVDLSGHSGNNRLPLFMRKPAPVQLTYLGYPNTTGLSNMDYRITDSLADPPGEERFYTERLHRLPRAFLCYRPPRQAPQPAPSPALHNGYITFGSFNNLPKITPAVISAWTEILQAVPGSRLMIKTKPFTDRAIRARYLQHFVAAGIAAGRLHFIGHADTIESHLACYHQVDIALDTFPYNGTTTTLEALWMGVPVVTLCGETHASRVGRTILANTGLNGLIADSLPRYVAIARFLAGDLERLGKFRNNLRTAVAASCLCDAATFTRQFEEGLEQMWREYEEKWERVKV